MYRHERDEIAGELRAIARQLDSVDDGDTDALIDVRAQLGSIVGLYNMRTESLWRRYCQEAREEHELMMRVEREGLELPIKGKIVSLFSRRKR